MKRYFVQVFSAPPLFVRLGADSTTLEFTNQPHVMHAQEVVDIIQVRDSIARTQRGTPELTVHSWGGFWIPIYTSTTYAPGVEIDTPKWYESPRGDK